MLWTIQIEKSLKYASVMAKEKHSGAKESEIQTEGDGGWKTFHSVSKMLLNLWFCEVVSELFLH